MKDKLLHASILGVTMCISTLAVANPCASPEAVQVFNERMIGAQKQSTAMTREHTKTVADPTIHEQAIKNARTCNDMVRDALDEVFAGTPIGGLMALFGLDKQSCDAIYGFTGNVDSGFVFNAAAAAAAAAAANNNSGSSNPNQPTEPDPGAFNTYTWMSTGQYSPCTFTVGNGEGDQITGSQHLLYQCTNSQGAIVIPSMCSGTPPRITRACSNMNPQGGSTASGGVSNAIY